MKSRQFAAYTLLGCAFLASCVPYDESRGKKPGQPKPGSDQTVTSPEQQEIQKKRDELKKKEEELKKKEEELAKKPEGDSGSTGGGTVEPPVTKPGGAKPEYAYAQKVPGKDGFVFSPYNNKIVDVRDIPSGTLVQDPTYTGAGKGYFRVP